MELTLQNFRDAIGRLNRGYLKVDGETVVKQGNSAIGSFFGVGKSGTAEQNREIREGFVKALSEAGANEAFLANVRARLGLAPESPAARTLLARKLAAEILRDFDTQKVEMMPNLIDLTGSSKRAHSPEAMKMRQQAVRLLANFTQLPVGEIDVLSNKTLVQLSEAVRLGGITDAVKLKDYLRTLTDPKLSAEDAQKILEGLDGVDQNPEVETSTRYTSEEALALVEHLESQSQKADVVDTKALHQTKDGFEIVEDTPAEVAARLNEVVDQIHDTKKDLAEAEEEIASLKQEGELLAADKAKTQAEMEEVRGLTEEAISKLPLLEKVKANWRKSKLATGGYERELKSLDDRLANNAEALSSAVANKAQLEESLPVLEKQHQALLVGKNPVLDAEQKKATQSFEQKVRAFAADIFSSDETWEMDRAEKNPAARLKALFTKNTDLIATLLDMPEADLQTVFSGPLADLMGALIGSIRDEVPSLKMLGVSIGDCFKAALPQLGDKVFAGINAKIDEKINEKSAAMSEQMKGLVKEALGGTGKDVLRQKGTRLGELKTRTLNELVKGAVDTEHGYGEFMKDAMTQYFDRVPMSIKRQMFAAAIRYMDYQKPIDQMKLSEGARVKEETRRQMLMLGAMLKGAGPILQKMMQGLSEMPINEELKLALKDMKSNLAPIPEPMVKAHLLSVVENSQGKIKAIKVKANLGAASVGQAFLCTMTSVDDQGRDVETEVVVKLLRPDVQARAEAEKQIFFDVAKGGMKNTFRSQLEGIMVEMDLTKEADNVEAGQIYTDNPFNGIAAMRLHPLVKATPSIMVLEKAPGTTVERYFTDTKAKYQAIVKDVMVTDVDGKPTTIGFKRGTSYIAQLRARKQTFDELKTLRRSMEAKQKKLVELSRKWVQEALFGSGMFHGDMHGGNIMIDDNPVAAENKGVTILDFGNAHKLSREQQESVLLMVGAASAQDTNRFLDGFRALLPPESRAEFDRKRAGEGTDENPSLHAIVHAIFYKDGTTCKQTGQRILACLQELQKEGIELPGAINNFSQSQIRLQGVIDQANEQLEEVELLMKRLAMDISDGEGATFDKFSPTTVVKTTDLVNEEFNVHLRRVVKQENDYAADSKKEVTLSRCYLPLTAQTGTNFQKTADGMVPPAKFQALKAERIDLLTGTDQVDKVQNIFVSLRQYCEGKFEPFSTNLKHAFDTFLELSKQLRPKLHTEIESADVQGQWTLAANEEDALDEKLAGLNERKAKLESDLETHRKALADMNEIGRTNPATLKSLESNIRVIKSETEKEEAELAALLPQIKTLTARREKVHTRVQELRAQMLALEAAAGRMAPDELDEAQLGQLKAHADEVVTIYLQAQKTMLEDLAKNHASYRKEINANTSPESFFDMMAGLLQDNMWATVRRLGATGLKWVLSGKVRL